MLKSLEKLRSGHWLPAGRTICEEEALADEIQTEVDRFYLPRPLFEDGEPVQVGDYVDLQMEGKRRVQVTDIRPWIVYGSSTSHQKEPYKRPPEPDTQEKIDADAMLKPSDYCAKRGLDFRRHTGPISEWPDIVMRKDLLARQRKLDGVE